MSKAKKESVTKEEELVEVATLSEVKKVTIHDIEWTDYVLGLLTEDEKINGNPTTDGLRRIFEVALNCRVLASTSQVAQSPSPENEKRATVVHSITYRLDPESSDPNNLNTLVVEGAADVYWGNCDKIYRNHPVAVAETRAEGRALRRGLRLRKVVAAEEIAKDIEDHPDALNVSKISPNQINFIDVISKRININVKNLLSKLGIENSNIYEISHENAVLVLRELSKLQQNLNDIPTDIMSYDANWR
jgi:DNA-binding Xre family transcriptional regulator